MVCVENFRIFAKYKIESMKNDFRFGEQEKEAPTIAPTIAPPITIPRREDDPSRIPYKRPNVDPNPKA